MADHNELGKLGEQIAKKELEQKGFEILACNWQHSSDEIDIIAKDKEQLVIVEVKTRQDNTIELPQDAVTRKKQKFLIRAAEKYIDQHELDCETRFDIVAITMLKHGYEVEHIEDAFYPTL